MNIKKNIFPLAVVTIVYIFFIIAGYFNSSGMRTKSKNILFKKAEQNTAGELSGYYNEIASKSVQLYIQKYKNSLININADVTSSKNKDEKPDTLRKGQSEDTQSVYSDMGISVANTYVNIRDKAGEDGKIIGKLYRNAAAKILDETNGWYYIESGSVKGYVKSEYLKTNIPYDELVKKYGIIHIAVNTEGLNVRKSAESDYEKVAVIYMNECYPAISLLDEWVQIEIPDKNITGYVSRKYVKLQVDFKKAISAEEERQKQKAKTIKEIHLTTQTKTLNCWSVWFRRKPAIKVMKVSLL